MVLFSDLREVFSIRVTIRDIKSTMGWNKNDEIIPNKSIYKRRQICIYCGEVENMGMTVKVEPSPMGPIHWKEYHCLKCGKRFDVDL